MKTVVERDSDKGILVCLPDGQVNFVDSAKAARKMHDVWALEKANSGSGIHVGKIEWRGFTREELERDNLL